eukprot:180138-Prymnesium_polylepis.1
MWSSGTPSPSGSVSRTRKVLWSRNLDKQGNDVALALVHTPDRIAVLRCVAYMPLLHQSMHHLEAVYLGCDDHTRPLLLDHSKRLHCQADLLAALWAQLPCWGHGDRSDRDRPGFPWEDLFPRKGQIARNQASQGTHTVSICAVYTCSDREAVPMSLRASPASATAPRKRLEEVLDVGARYNKKKPYRLASKFDTVADLGSDVIVVRDDIPLADQQRLADILRRVMRGEKITDEELDFLNTLG